MPMARESEAGANFQVAASEIANTATSAKRVNQQPRPRFLCFDEVPVGGSS